MPNGTLIVHQLVRFPQQENEDMLAFEPGVNVIVGPPNTGKTKWLSMLDYLFGDPDSPEDSLGEDIADKYNAIQAQVSISGETLNLERRWGERGARTKVFVNEDPLTDMAFQEFLMGKLGIPIIHYPQGNPYGPRAWPLLSWRGMYRHMFRQQTYWSDIADRQFVSEQYACLLQFLGIAERYYSRQYAELVSKENKVRELQSRKDQFIDMLQEVSREITDEEELGVALTPESLGAAIGRVQAEAEDLQQRRNAILSSLRRTASTQIAQDSPSAADDEAETLGDELARLRQEQQIIVDQISKVRSRLDEVLDYRGLIADELSRMSRAREAGQRLSSLRITHCPACDRDVEQPDHQLRNCFLCGRDLPEDTHAEDQTDQRLDFEHEQLASNLREAERLVDTLSHEAQTLEAKRVEIAQSLAKTERLLTPMRTAVAAILPPDVGILDMRVGQLQERGQQLERIGSALDRRQALSADILSLQQEIAELGVAIAHITSGIDYESAADLLGDRMNDYLNSLKRIAPSTWTQPEVRVALMENGFRMMIGNKNWATKLGGTLTIYFLLAYHYALLSLSHEPGCHYPGICVVNFPAEVEGEEWRSDEENFVLEPFVELLSRPHMKDTQVIAAGRSFENLENANRIELTRVWA